MLATELTGDYSDQTFTGKLLTACRTHGYLPIDKEDSNLFFQLIDMRYEKKSTILTTNINFSEWDSVFYDAVVANAILDRVLHHANVVSISGKSYRLKDHMKATD
ncbi:ATP-binding protein [[Clostridium] polysaccharolyticum]|nr:ATP-binding protein [[Clostridium] polysaccharolyticum]